MRLLQPTSDVDVQIEPLEQGEERGIRPELRTEAAQIHHADRRETDPAYRFRDVAEVDLRLTGLPPDHAAIPVKTREGFGRPCVQDCEGVQRGQGLRTTDYALHVEHLAVQDLIRYAAPGVEPTDAALPEMPDHLDVRYAPSG